MADARDQYAEQLLGVVADAARTVSTRFVTFLTVGVYVAVTIASTTDEMLVKGSLVKLPLLNTEIPISGWFGFYTVAPWLIVILHLDLLLQLSMLGHKLTHFNAEAAPLSEEQRRRFRDRLPNYYYVQFLAGEAPSRFLHLLSGLVICSSMILLPLLLLCWVQLRFLALHDVAVTWWHRAAVIADVLIILAFLWRPLSERDAQRLQRDARTRGPLRRLLSLQILVLVVCAGVLAFSVIASIPDEKGEPGLWFALRNLDLRERVLTKDALSPQAINALSDGDVQRREQELAKVSRLSFLQGRDLRFANFFNAVLPRLDLRSRREGDELIETRLQGADLQFAQMQQVLLDDANLQGALLRGAQLQGGSLPRAKLQGADLTHAQLQEANLVGAVLDGAVLRDAQLQGANLSTAVLHGTRLTGAQLQGAALRAAHLQGADLAGAVLQGADLSDAQLEGATLRGADLQGALLHGATIGSADLTDANLDLTGVTPSGAGRRAVDADALAAYLLGLACADPYTARGLSAQVLSSPGGGRRALGKTMLARIDTDADCRGLQLLPEATRAALQRQIEEGPATQDVVGGGAGLPKP
jgi:uncharacterized protein YjbI with pentapeptide repeats